MTRPTLDVLRLLLEAPDDEPLWGARISQRAALCKSTVSQIIARLAHRQWITLHQEQGSHPGRPARTLCTLTQRGRREAETVLAAQEATRTQQDPPDLTESVTQQNPARSHGRGPGSHHPIHFPDLEALRRAAPDQMDRGVVQLAHAIERMTALREALGVFRAFNEILTTGFLARSAVSDVHRREHWIIMNEFLVNAAEISSKALRAHNY